MLTRRLPLLAVLVALLTVPAGAAGAPEAPTPRGGERMVKEKSAQREQQQRDRAARRNSTAERQRRKDSQKAFAKLTSGEARKLAIATFSETLTSPIWEPLPLREGEKVAEYIGEFNAAVDTPGGRQVAVSTTPMRARDENNKLAAVDLALEKKGTAFVAKNSTVDLSIGQSAGSALRLARAGVSVTPVVEADVAYEQGHGRLWSENVAPDTDQMVQPTTLGAELLWQIRSTEAPEQVRLRFSVPDGARVELDPVIKGLAGRPSGFARGIRVVKDGELITRVTAPQAFGADGEAIAAWYDVAGNDVLVQFPHRNQDVKYPLLVDPQITEYWNPGDWNNSGWQFYEDRFGGPHPFSPAIDCCGHPGLAVGAFQFATYNQNAFAHWYWYTDPKAYIAVAEMGELWHQPNGKSLSHSAVYDPAVGYVSYQATATASTAAMSATTPPTLATTPPRPSG